MSAVFRQFSLLKLSSLVECLCPLLLLAFWLSLRLCWWWTWVIRCTTYYSIFYLLERKFSADLCVSCVPGCSPTRRCPEWLCVSWPVRRRLRDETPDCPLTCPCLSEGECWERTRLLRTLKVLCLSEMGRGIADRVRLLLGEKDGGLAPAEASSLMLCSCVSNLSLTSPLPCPLSCLP